VVRNFPECSQRAGIAVKGNSIAIWDVGQSAFLRQMTFANDPPRPPAAFSPDGRSLARVNEEGGVTIWELATGRLRRYFGKKPKDTVAPEADENGAGIGAVARRLPARPVLSKQTKTMATLLFSPDSRLLCLSGPGNVVTEKTGETTGMTRPICSSNCRNSKSPASLVN